MTALDLKKQINRIPDNEEVYYGYYSHHSENNAKDDDFDINFYFKKSGEKFWLICGEKPYDALSQDEIERAQKWQVIASSFPKKTSWFLKQETWNNNRGYVNFRVGTFAYSIAVSIGRDKLIQGSFEKSEQFDSWDEFFKMAVPFVKKAAQKQREELESLLDS